MIARRLKIGLLCLFAGMAGALLVLTSRTDAAVGPTITDYYTACKGGTPGKVSTWHGKNRDGKPPYDPDRRTYDFRCEKEEIYSPAAGTVYGVTPRYGGVVVVDDKVNGACMVFLGMKTTAVKPKQEIKAGTFMGTYRIFHFTAVNGNCEQVNFYDVEARNRERPIKFIEFGEVIAPDIRRPKFHEFTSQNPSQTVEVTRVQVFLVSLDAHICHDVPASECPVGVVGIERSLTFTDTSIEGKITGALNDLFSIKDKTVGEDALYNALYNAALKVERVTVEQETATIYLVGTLKLDAPDDARRADAQITSTVQQFPSVKAVIVFLNDKPLVPKN